jgi:hypothetical protein
MCRLTCTFNLHVSCTEWNEHSLFSMNLKSPGSVVSFFSIDMVRSRMALSSASLPHSTGRRSNVCSTLLFVTLLLCVPSWSSGQEINVGIADHAAESGGYISTDMTSSDYFSKLVVTSSPVFGVVKKMAPLPVRKADVKFSNESALECLMAKKEQREKNATLTEPCPMAGRCALFINHR